MLVAVAVVVVADDDKGALNHVNCFGYVCVGAD